MVSLGLCFVSLGILSIRQVNRSDEGTYICRAENTAGPQQIHVVFVEVLRTSSLSAFLVKVLLLLGCRRQSFAIVKRALPMIRIFFKISFCSVPDRPTILYYLQEF